MALSLAAATAASLLARLPAAADGNVATYIDTTGNWSDPGVWNTETPPGDGDFANIFGSGTAAAVLTFNDISGATGNLASVVIDLPSVASGGGAGGASILLKQTSSWFATDTEYVGYSGAAALSITGGSHNVGTGPHGPGPLLIGLNGGSSGSITLGSGAALSVGGTTYVGFDGSGTFAQTGGFHTAGGLVVGSSGPGTYTMSGSGDASLFVSGPETVGDAATGTFNQLTGAHAAGSLILGASQGGSGSYSLSGNTSRLTIFGTEIVGGSGTGTFNQTAGVHQAGALIVGQANSGTIALSGAASLNVNGPETIGSGGTGSFTQSGGAHSAGSLTVGAAATGSYTMSGATSSLSVLGGVIVGDSGVGSFTQSAGSHTAAWLAIGNSPAGSGAYTLNAGSATFGDVGVGGNPYFNGGGTGSLVVNGPSAALTVNGSLTSYAGGTVTLAGGSLTTGSLYTDPNGSPVQWTAGALTVTSAAPFMIGPGGPIGSAVSIDASKSLTVGGTLTVNPGGTLGLSGGTLTAANLDLSAVGPSAFTWTTGTLNLTGTAGTTVDPSGPLSNPFTLGAGQILNIAGRLTVGASGSATFNQFGGQQSVGSLDLGLLSGASGTFAMSNGTLTVATKAYIGDGGQGVLNLSGGRITVNDGANAVFLGNRPGGSGTINLSGGTFAASDVYVGYAGSGAVNQTGGSQLLNGFLVLGGQPDGVGGAGAFGSYNLSNGQLNANTIYVGLSGTGSFSQSGGNITVGQITAGYFSGASGTVTFSGNANVFEAGPEIYGDNGTGTFIQSGGSQLNAGVILGNGATGAGTAQFSGGVMTVSGVTIVGNNGRGTFYQTGGTHAPSNFYVGLAATGAGYYSLSPGATLHVTSDFSGGNQYNGTEYIGYYGNATFDQFGGSHTVDGYFAIAYSFGSSATFNLSGGTFAAGAESIGFNSNANNTFNQTAGANTSSSYVTIGDQPNGRGTYNLSGDGSTLSAGALYDSWAGLGTFNQSGGSVNVGTLFVAHEASANSSYNLSGGTLNVTNGEIIGYSGNGTVTQTGGTHTVAGTATVTIALTGGSVGTYNLRGGSFIAGPVVNNGALNLSGGTATFGALSGRGATTLTGSNPAAPTTLTVSSFAQSTLAIGNNAAVAVLPNATTSFTNTVGTLSITGTGTLDLANHALQTSTPAATVRQYLVNGYAGGSWNGGGGIFSSVIAANNAGTLKQYALGYAAAGQFNVVPTVPAGTVLVRPTLFGDTNLDGKVDNADISAIVAAGHYMDGSTNNSWAVGDWNYDGKVDNQDISMLVASGNYLSGQTYNGVVASGGASPAVKLTSAALAKNSVTTVGVSGDGIPDYVYDPSTGDVKFRTDGVSGLVQEVHIKSASGQLNYQAVFSADPQAGFGQDVVNANEIDLFRQGPDPRTGQTRQFPDNYDLGDILGLNLSQNLLLQDLTLSYTINGGGLSNEPSDLISNGSGTPEPTGLALIGVAAAGLLGRRKRRL